MWSWDGIKFIRISEAFSCVGVLHPTNSYGNTETGPRFNVSSERLEKPGIKLMTPGLKGHYTTEASQEHLMITHNLSFYG